MGDSSFVVDSGLYFAGDGRRGVVLPPAGSLRHLAAQVSLALFHLSKGVGCRVQGVGCRVYKVGCSAKDVNGRRYKVGFKV